MSGVLLLNPAAVCSEYAFGGVMPNGEIHLTFPPRQQKTAGFGGVGGVAI